MSPTLNKLLNDTFNNYDKRIRPFENERPLIFSSRITVAMLINLVSEAQTVSFNMAQYLRWQDPRLAWDPAKYNNTNQIYVPSSLLWMPTLFFYNSIQTDSALTDPTALVTIALATFFALVILLGIVADAMPKSNSMSVIAYIDCMERYNNKDIPRNDLDGNTAGCKAYVWSDWYGGTYWLKSATGPLVDQDVSKNIGAGIL
uniref:Neurotransmitter-gated ion-channel ligand-binding domain-containing protein n=1 Tax=Acrobeloides nanus TaxID=290746 RepID=A0A914DWD6_9BILA